jgi:hypothetical protein
MPAVATPSTSSSIEPLSSRQRSTLTTTFKKTGAKMANADSSL